MEQTFLHAVDGGDCSFVGGFEPVGGVVPVDRIRDEPEFAFLMVKNRDLGWEHHHQFGNAEIIDGVARKLLDLPNDVVAHETDQPCVERRHVRHRFSRQFGECLADEIQRSTLRGEFGQFAALPRGLTVARRQNRLCSYADDRIPAPDAGLG